jgi:hypothetical protein
MTKLKLLGAAALVLSLATPAMAQDAVQRPGHDSARMNNNTRMNNRVGQHRHMARNDSRMGYRHDNRTAYRTGNPDWNNNGSNGRHDSGFWPGDVAADVVGGAAATARVAVGTAGTIATAPFRNDDSYAYDNSGYNDGWDRHDSGFWPGNVAADVVGGAAATADAAVGTPGAIATAPFRNDSYAYDNNGYNNGWYHQSYAERNGFVCQPGTWFKGEDGHRHICQ